jgi:uncharacterized membrane protein YedE/YeeE
MGRRLPWWAGGILMSLLLLFTFSIFGADRPIGASTYVSYYSGILFGMNPDDYSYLKHIEKSGAWEGIMLLGALVGGFFTSVFVTKSFRITLIPTAWKVYKNNSILSRMAWSFVSGFFLIIGARLAGGCTSGHFLSGMSQTAISGMIFGGVVLVTLLITGKIFYKSKVDL